jgi:hypothetical protein
MRKSHMTAYAFVFVAAFICCAQSRFEVEKTIKPIQSDGFLLEWRLDYAFMVDSKHDMRLDAANTARGLAGYVRVMSRDTCRQWILRLYPKPGMREKYLEIAMPVQSDSSAFYSIDTILTDTAVFAVAEWVLAWDVLQPDSATGAYEIGFSAFNNCGDTANAAIISGAYNQQIYQGIWSRRLIGQVAIIALLLVAYFVLSARARKLGRKA